MVLKHYCHYPLGSFNRNVLNGAAATVGKAKMVRSGIQSKPKLSVILVADLEDFSLWAPAVEPSVVSTLFERFFEAANLLLEIFSGTFLKSTGDGIIAIWDHPFDSESPSLSQEDASSVIRSIEQAATMSVALQLLTYLRFGLSWPTPRFLRCALHIGILRRTRFTRLGTNQIDYIGEPLNAACRLEQYGQNINGPVTTEHIQALLSTHREDTLVTIALPVTFYKPSIPKGAEWVSKQLFYLPTVALLSLGQDQEPGDDVLAAVKRNMSIFQFRYLKALNILYPGSSPLTPEVMRSAVPEWMNILPSYFAAFLKNVNFTIDETIAKAYLEGLKEGMMRYLIEQQPWRFSNPVAVNAEIESVLNEIGQSFPPLARFLLPQNGSTTP